MLSKKYQNTAFFREADTWQNNHAPDRAVWQQELANAVSDVQELYRLLELEVPDTLFKPKKFALKVPHAFVAKMKKGDATDPLLRQIVPSSDEQKTVLGFGIDPLAENAHNPQKGLLHKYKNRVLITLTGACAVHCRYCFRQHFDYGANLPSAQEMAQISDYIKKNTDIDEVLLSGGDPLLLKTSKLAAWFGEFEQIQHLKTIRIHSRVPVVLPSRIDDELLDLCRQPSKKLVMVLHINHPNEIDDTLAQKCQLLKQAGVTLLNQTVLLKGINDSAEVLVQLSHRLFDVGVLPYYLHILDKVAGAAHFDLELKTAIDIYWQLLERLSGYLVPKLVQELPNRPCKTPVDIHQFRPKHP